MATKLVTTKSYEGLRAISQAKGKRIGKVRRIVFHPTEKRVIGLMIKRPDAALMFHRKDLFAALGGFHVEEGQVVVHEDEAATDRGAVKALGVDWDSCVIWVGMPVVTQSGQQLGFVGVVTFDRATGVVDSFTIVNDAANDAILGKRVIPAHHVRGFKRGMGMQLASVGSAQGDEETADLGAILVSDEVLNLPVEGGAAAAAGKASAVVADKAKKSVTRARAAASEQAERAKPIAQEAAKKTGKAIDAGSFAVGKQLGKASGMFAAFKEEFDKASHGDGK